MFKWLHHILEPHCPECKAEREELKVCRSCESLMHQLEMANYDKQKLIDTISSMAKPPMVPESTAKTYEIPKPRTIPWKVMQQQLEAEDRKAFELLQAKKREEEALLKNKQHSPVVSVEELEKELGVS